MAHGRRFNETRFPSVRSASCNETFRRSAKFNDWIEDLQLINIEFSGDEHTWARGNSIETYQSGRLDGALCNAEWSILFDQA